MKFFISYCDSDGLAFASAAASCLESQGHQAWYFERDKAVGVLRIVDITTHIRDWCDKFLFLCTAASQVSTGQRKEIGQWDNTTKQLIVVPIDQAKVPQEIDPYVYQRMSSVGFEKGFEAFIVTQLEQIVHSNEELSPMLKVSNTARVTV